MLNCTIYMYVNHRVSTCTRTFVSAVLCLEHRNPAIVSSRTPCNRIDAGIWACCKKYLSFLFLTIPLHFSFCIFTADHALQTSRLGHAIVEVYSLPVVP